MRDHRSATRDAVLWGRMRRWFGAAIWCVATMTLTYAAIFTTFILVSVMADGEGGVRVPRRRPPSRYPRFQS